MSRNKGKREKEKKSRHIGRKIFIIILILLAIGGGIFAKKVYDLGGDIPAVIAALLGHNKKTVEELDKIYILAMGESTGMSDTMIVCSYDPKTQEASMLSIPRDTYVGTNKNKANAYDKLNAQYSNGTTPEKTIEKINEITGLDIKYYVLVDTKALKELVDLIGGIDFDVPDNMNYDDDSQNLHIHLKKGLQHLDGDKVEQVVRFRHNNDGTSYSYKYGDNDYGRMRTQRAVITTVLEKAKSSMNVKRITEILELTKKYVQTNMDLSILKDYIPYVLQMNTESMQSEQLPGESKKINGIWFFLHDEEKTKETIDRLFLKTNVEENNNSVNEI